MEYSPTQRVKVKRAARKLPVWVLFSSKAHLTLSNRLGLRAAVTLADWFGALMSSHVFIDSKAATVRPTKKRLHPRNHHQTIPSIPNLDVSFSRKMAATIRPSLLLNSFARDLPHEPFQLNVACSPQHGFLLGDLVPKLHRTSYIYRYN